ncbi:universal stress protein [Halobaculum marinum]|uniref:Universal stress protein n=1 Tax=Halobaculum marinum TaxID=3031996 RepID=A0ABD5WXD8_9EURY|nr:universal stress protein [Halobaculum sp. DT55]
MLYVLATNSVERSEALCAYLDPRVAEGDTVHAVNSQRGGDHTTQEQLDRGKDALAVVNRRLSPVTAVETHQLVRGNSPAEDVLEFVERYEADEIVMGVRKRTPASKLLFGSVAQEILMNSTVPMRVVPVPGGR